MFTGTPTQLLKLPQFEPRDHADFLTDFNGAFKRIDENASEVSQTLNELTLRIEELERKLAQTRIDAGLTNASMNREETNTNG